MRFLKSLTLPHRRTKSESFLAQGETYSLSRDPCISPDDPGSSSTTTVAAESRTTTALNLRLLDLDIQNRRLRDANIGWALEYAKLEAVLKASREDLLTFRKDYAAADNKSLERLQATFDNVAAIMTRLGLTTLIEEPLQDGQELERQIIDAIQEAAVIPGNIWTKVIPSLLVYSSPRQYASALRMTLDTRKELRKSKKVVKFWKHLAKMDGQHLEAVTPSASNISSVCESNLTPDRRTALEMLIAQRRQYLRGV